MDQVETIVINNFEGKLTRVRNGMLNSGFAKFDTSFGYNPFFKPGQLSWFKDTFNLSTLITNGVALAGVSRVESGGVVTYIITSTGHLYRIIGEGGGGTDLHTLATGSPTFTYGADITFFGGANNLYISHDLGVTKIVITSGGSYSSETQVGTWDATHFTPITTRRGLSQFLGKLYIINSDPSVTYANNIAEIDATETVTSYAKLSPSLPDGTYIRDLDVNPDFTYLLITSSMTPSELIAPVNDGGNTASTYSDLYKWNGIDPGITTGIALPSFSATALQSFGNSQLMFMYDTFGASLYDAGVKVLTMRNQKSPFPTSTASTGNFVSWTCTDFYWNQDTQAGATYGSMYYYGSLETEPPRLYRMFRQQSAIGGSIYQMPYMAFTTNRYISVNTSDVPQVDANGTHIFSFIDYGGGATINNKFYAFYVAPPDDSPAGWTGAIAGVYETQNQLFSKKVAIKQIRVYSEPTVANNGFQVDIIGGDGKKVSNGTFNYTFASGTNQTLLQGGQERINFNPSINSLYSLALRVTNTGSVNMFINKIEIDYIQQGK